MFLLHGNPFLNFLVFVRREAGPDFNNIISILVLSHNGVGANPCDAHITVHAVNLGDVVGATLRALYPHLHLLITTVIAVVKGEINALVESHLHRTVNQRLDRLDVVSEIVSAILDFPAIEVVPEAVFKVLLLNGRYFLCDMAVE